MKAINKNAKKVMDKLTAGLGFGESKKVDNTKGTFMPVHVMLISQTSIGPLFAVTHYYKQNGDLMRDPEMIFAKGWDENYYPVHFRQDGGIPIYQDSATFDSNGEWKGLRPRMQRDHAVFAGQWMKNIKEQQRL